mmetsp:Transcript_13909/g.37312  ORF Transcript_13909/g.37312 Transcript_13909/m.37312 type:complete len:411 (-) Transcript_13909:1407-2639(-)
MSGDVIASRGERGVGCGWKRCVIGLAAHCSGAMKWGKYLNAVVNETPEWAPFYVNYKKLKGCIKRVQEGQRERRLREGADEAVEAKLAMLDMRGIAFSTDPEWRRELVGRVAVESLEFYSELNGEMVKINAFFDSEHAALSSYLESNAGKGALLAQTRAHVQQIIQKFQEYATVNYTALVKALKKHDKNLEVSTQALYTQRVLNFQKFHVQVGAAVAQLSARLAALGAVPRELTAGLDDDDVAHDVARAASVSAVPGVRRDTGMYKARQVRDLNNDVMRPSYVKKEALCVPIRGKGSKAEVLTVRGSDSGAGGAVLVKATLESGESTADAAVRALLDVAGAEAHIVRQIGEFASTTRRNTVYDAYLLAVTRELDEWTLGSATDRRWLQIDDAIAEIEDNSSIRVLRKVDS